MNEWLDVFGPTEARYRQHGSIIGWCPAHPSSPRQTKAIAPEYRRLYVVFTHSKALFARFLDDTSSTRALLCIFPMIAIRYLRSGASARGSGCACSRRLYCFFFFACVLVSCMCVFFFFLGWGGFRIQNVDALCLS